jgi:uncharacterized RDD family membrane protein YckC
MNIQRWDKRRWLRLGLGLVLVGAVSVAADVALSARQAPPAPVAPEAPAAPIVNPVPEAPAAPAARSTVQAPEAPEVPDAPDASDESDVVDQELRQSPWSRPAVRVGQDFRLAQGDRVREIVTVFGSSTIAGEVDRDVVVVFGSVRLEPTAVIHGSVVVTAGGLTVAEGARIDRDVVVTGGSVDAPAGFAPAREYVVVGLPGMGRQAEAIVPFFTRGLLWGRLIVPSLPWLWVVVAVIVLAYLAINMLFDRAVVACRQAITDRPLGSFLMGLLVLVLIGPVSFILLVSVIGIPVVPFLVCGLFIAGLLGKVGVTRWIGASLMAETDPDSKGQSVRSFFIGTAVILLAYMVPVLGILVWAIGGMLGLGAATLAFSSGLRRENRKKRAIVPPAAAAPVPASAAVPAPTWEPYTTPVAATGEGDRSELRAEVPPAFTGRPVEPPPAVPLSAATTSGPAVLVAMPKAPFLDRLAAFALDVLLVSLTFNLLDMDSVRAFFTLLLCYHVIFWTLKATTVGGIICNLRVVRTDGNPLGFADALIRGLSSIFSIAALGIGCLWILYDADSQAWHDRFAGTYVVKVPRHWPL